MSVVKLALIPPSFRTVPPVRLPAGVALRFPRATSNKTAVNPVLAFVQPERTRIREHRAVFSVSQVPILSLLVAPTVPTASLARQVHLAPTAQPIAKRVSPDIFPKWACLFVFHA